MADLTDDDIHGLIDGQLDVTRRIEVCRALGAEPERAARTFADIALRDTLRLGAAVGDRVPPRMRTLSSDLGRALVRPRRDQLFARAAVLLACVGLGWSLQFGFERLAPGAGEPTYEEFVEGAVNARRSARLEALLPGNHEKAVYDRGVIYTTTDIPLPALPHDWSVSDVQIHPWEGGQSVGVLADTETLGTVTLFVAPTDREGNLDPTYEKKDGLNAVYWQIEDNLYALVARAPEKDLEKTADVLVASLTSN